MKRSSNLRRRAQTLSNTQLANHYLHATNHAEKRAYFTEIKARVNRHPNLGKSGPMRKALTSTKEGRQIVERATIKAIRHERRVASNKPKVEGRIGHVYLYLDTDDAFMAFSAYVELSKLLRELGIEHEIVNVERGSVFADLAAYFPDDPDMPAKFLEVIGDDLKRLASAKLNREAIELENILSQNVANILSLSIDNICIDLGHMCIIKLTDPDGTTYATAKRLSKSDRRHLELNPRLRVDPKGFLDYLDQQIELDAMLESDAPVSADPESGE